jgi:hypothetical protein
MVSADVKRMYAFMVILAWTKGLRFHNASGLCLLANQQGAHPLFGKKNRPFFHCIPHIVSPTRKVRSILRIRR